MHCINYKINLYCTGAYVMLSSDRYVIANIESLVPRLEMKLL